MVFEIAFLHFAPQKYVNDESPSIRVIKNKSNLHPE